MLGRVYWDDSGIPVRLEFDTGETLFFNRNGIWVDTEDFQFEELRQIAQDIDNQIEAAKQQIQQCQDTKEELSEIDEAISYFDSVACGSIEVDEDANTLTATISTHEIGERVEELHRKFRWGSFEVDHLQDLRLFKVRMEMPLARVERGPGASANQD
jgi:chaperonin cofactor prefoldin